MFKKKRETDTLTQQRTRQYVKIQADNPALIIAITAVFALFGLFLCVAGFAKAMKLSAEELKEKENLSDKGEEAEDESGGN